MKIKYVAPLVVVRDIDVAKKFYRDVLLRKIVMDFGENVTFTGGFSIQQKALWSKFIDRKEEEIINGANDFELYFEVEDLDEFLLHLNKYPHVVLVHPLKEYSWGQRVIRIYDPDKNIIEIGESMKTVILRLLKQGMTIEEVSTKTMHPISIIEKYKNKS